MPDTKAIANRIKSVRDTKKITNAMYLISSTKLRKARKSLDNTRPFFDTLKKEIGNIIRKTEVLNTRYLITDDKESHTEGYCGILVITSDKGLAGAYNQNIIKETLRMIELHPDSKLFVLGEYGKHYFASHNIPYDEGFAFPDEEPTLFQARQIAGYIMNCFDTGKISQVYIIYTDFKNALTSEVTSMRLIPFELSHFEDYESDEPDVEYEYFSSPSEVMERSIPVYTIGIIYSVLVYSFCCEQNDRMMAMDAANQNADNLVGELTVKYNHLRQNSITQEITEISASVKGNRCGS